MITLQGIRDGGKAAVARALAAIETDGGIERHAALLDECTQSSSGHVLGLTGPPGVGKSTLTNALLRHFRGMGKSLAILAVDPSSRVTGGALLGDRTRLKTDPDDRKLFVRSMAARDRLGGLSHHAIAAVALLRTIYDQVIVESVGIGQSEADVAMVADSVVLCIQPGSGDSLQFMKAGVMEIPDIVVVTKSDTGPAARRAVADVEGALTLTVRDHGAWVPPVIALSSVSGDGMEQLFAMIEDHTRFQLSRNAGHTLSDVMQRQWVADRVKEEFGTHGVAQADIGEAMAEAGGPFRAMAMLRARLAAVKSQSP